MLWIFLAIAAAAFQTLRFSLQKILSMGALSAGGATYARFLYAAPFVVSLALVSLWFSDTGLAELGGLSARFWLFALGGGLFQILATWAVVALFAQRSFAVGIAFKKTEVLQAALVGFVVLGDVVSPAGLGAILLGFFGVIALSAAPASAGNLWRGLFNRAAGLGLLSGAMFALSAVGYRGAVLELSGAGPFISAVVTLAVVSTAQSLAMGLWLRLYQPGEIGRVVCAWRQAVWLGLAGMAGSLCWFTAFSLQNAAYVFAVGQVEVIFSIAVSVLFFAERLRRREVFGIALLSASIIILVLLA